MHSRLPKHATQITAALRRTSLPCSWCRQGWACRRLKINQHAGETASHAAWLPFHSPQSSCCRAVTEKVKSRHDSCCQPPMQQLTTQPQQHKTLLQCTARTAIDGCSADSAGQALAGVAASWQVRVMQTWHMPCLLFTCWQCSVTASPGPRTGPPQMWHTCSGCTCAQQTRTHAHRHARRQNTACFTPTDMWTQHAAAKGVPKSQINWQQLHAHCCQGLVQHVQTHVGSLTPNACTQSCAT